MKKFVCDNCGSEQDVSSYTVHQTSPLNLEYPKRPIQEFYGDGIALPIQYFEYPKTKELCESCKINIDEAYKHFLEEWIP
jgi:predicted RNA-binding Zn-ribbon protein involved in translation (DUF1610 family)